MAVFDFLNRPGNHILGAGVLYFDDGSGERPIIETDSLTINVEVERVSKLLALDGAVVAGASRPISIRRWIATQSLDIMLDNLVAFFMGDASVDPIDDDQVVFPETKKGRWYQCTPHPMPFTIDDIFFEEEAAPEEGVHYQVDYARGRIQVLEDGLGELTVDYEVEEESTVDVVSMADTEVRGSLRFLSDPTTGAGWDLYCGQVIMRPGGPVEMKARSEWMRLPFEIDIVSEPWSTPAFLTRLGEEVDVAVPPTTLDLLLEYEWDAFFDARWLLDEGGLSPDDPVAAWRDLVTLADAVQPTESQRPVLRASATGAPQPVVRGDGVDDFIFLPDVAKFDITEDFHWIMRVYRGTAINSSAYISWDDTSIRAYNLQNLASSGAGGNINATVGGTGSGNTADLPLTRHVRTVEVLRAGGTAIVRIEGNEVRNWSAGSSTPTGDPTPKLLCRGSDASTSLHTNGGFSALGLRIGSVFSGAELTEIRNLLDERYPDDS
jgi:hypothetical protein